MPLSVLELVWVPHHNGKPPQNMVRLHKHSQCYFSSPPPPPKRHSNRLNHTQSHLAGKIALWVLVQDHHVLWRYVGIAVIGIDISILYTSIPLHRVGNMQTVQHMLHPLRQWSPFPQLRPQQRQCQSCSQQQYISTQVFQGYSWGHYVVVTTSSELWGGEHVLSGSTMQCGH